MKIGERVDMLEKAMVQHLEESGEIRADLKWLKKMMWGVASLIITIVIEGIIRR